MSFASRIADRSEPTVTVERDAPRRFVRSVAVSLSVAAAIGPGLGTVAVGPVALYPLRIIVPVLVVVIGVGPLARTVTTLGQASILALAGWSLLTIVWTPDTVAGVKEASIFVFAALSTALCLWLVRRPGGAAGLLVGWTCGVGLTLAVAAVELVLRVHLPSEYARQYPGDGSVLATFANPNNYGAYLAFSTPLLAAAGTGLGAALGLSHRSRLAARLLAGVAAAMLVFAGSRLAFAGLAMGAILYATLRFRWPSTIRAGVAVAGAAVVAGLWAIGTNQILVRKLAGVFESGGLAQNSRDGRWNLIKDGVWFAVDTRGIGLGAGGFVPRMRRGDLPYFVRPDVVNPHNFWVEVLAGYGLVGLGLVVVLVWSITAKLMRAARHGRTPAVRQGATWLLAAMVAHAFAAMAPSSYVNDPANWTFLGAMLALGVALDRLGLVAPAAPGVLHDPGLRSTVPTVRTSD